MGSDYRDDSKRNAEGYLDLTAYEAIKNVTESMPTEEEDNRFHKLLHTIFYLCELAGFQIEGRVALKDKKTGRIWR